MNSRCAWGSKSTGRVCDQPCEGRYCERHARVAAVREAGAVLRTAREAVAKAREAVVEAAKRWDDPLAWAVPMRAGGASLPPRHSRRADDDELGASVKALLAAERAEAEARARLEALR